MFQRKSKNFFFLSHMTFWNEISNQKMSLIFLLYKRNSYNYRVSNYCISLYNRYQNEINTHHRLLGTVEKLKAKPFNVSVF